MSCGGDLYHDYTTGESGEIIIIFTVLVDDVCGCHEIIPVSEIPGIMISFDDLGGFFMLSVTNSSTE